MTREALELLIAALDAAGVRRRGVSGDVAERLVADHLGGGLAPEGAPYDVVGRGEERVQVKTMHAEPDRANVRRVVPGRLKPDAFDVLWIIRHNRLRPERAITARSSVVRSRLSRARYLSLGPRFYDTPGVRCFPGDSLYTAR